METLIAVEPKKKGRRKKPEGTHKRSRGLSFTDAEYSELDRQATKGGFDGPSSYIVSKLNLS